MTKRHAPGWRPSADVIIRRATGLSVLAIVVGTVLAFFIAWSTAGMNVAWSLALGAGTVAIIAMMGWIVMSVVKRSHGSTLLITLGGYLLKLIAIAVIFTIAGDFVFFVPSAVGLAFICALLMNLVVVSVVVLSSPGPAIGED